MNGVFDIPMSKFFDEFLAGAQPAGTHDGVVMIVNHRIRSARAAGIPPHVLDTSDGMQDAYGALYRAVNRFGDEHGMAEDQSIARLYATLPFSGEPAGEGWNLREALIVLVAAARAERGEPGLAATPRGSADEDTEAGGDVWAMLYTLLARCAAVSPSSTGDEESAARQLPSGGHVQEEHGAAGPEIDIVEAKFVAPDRLLITGHLSGRPPVEESVGVLEVGRFVLAAEGTSNGEVVFDLFLPPQAIPATLAALPPGVAATLHSAAWQPLRIRLERNPA